MASDADGFADFMSFVGGSAAAEKDASAAATHGDDPSSSGVQTTLPSAVTAAANADEYHYEEEQEREAMMRSYHHPMKLWFRQHPALAERHGHFPLFWQDLKAWVPYREVLKEYIKATEGGGGSGDAAKPAEPSPPPNAEGETAAPSAASEGASEAAGDEQNPPKRRRKSRWGEDIVPPAPAVVVTPTPSPATATPTGDAAAATGEKKRKSRWAPAGAAPALGAASRLAPATQSQSALLRSKLDAISLKLTTVAADAARLEKDPARSPSPPPQYDASGKRTNTREVRMRAALEKNRQSVIEELLKVNPLFRPPADYLRQKLQRKIYIPIKEFPQYNFIGLIIGPRGNTQKRMEKESNCKIAIRGKGSVKEGSKGKKNTADENDDLHVLITGEREEDLERAAKEVQSLLVPMDDTKNQHKQQQLRELARINGTLRDDDFCHICGEKGHRQWECPNREQNTFRAPGIKCAICGDSSHPTRDCVQKRQTTAETVAIDEEYNSFMQQLGEKPVISTATRVTPVPPTASAPAPAPAPAPWLQPARTSAAVGTQPWMLKQSVGAPGTASAPPGMHGAVALGSTPATAYPPPVAPGAMYGGGYGAAQTQGAWGAGHHQQQQWGADYYYGAASAGAADYQQQQYGQYGVSTATAASSSAYGHYGPVTGAGGAGPVPVVPPAATVNGSAAGYYQYPPAQQQQQQQQHYYSSEPQQ
ncbi:hypothetical protein PybrP1_001418 [[Pythium] brassicae (nom. inval.)]|nr:hypothetical protein PybrP1_001418 [[Pythium] brassicae (nom. inval.)]